MNVTARINASLKLLVSATIFRMAAATPSKISPPACQPWKTTY